MKILLLGEFSGLHKNLKEGLVELGHDVTVAASGDGFKKIPSDISFESSMPGVIGKIIKAFLPLFYLSKMKGFDVVQVMNPFYFHMKGMFPSNYFFEKLRENNGKLFMLAAGDDAYFWKYGRKKLAYGPFEDFLKYDINQNDFYLNTEKSFIFNREILKKFHGIIPIMYEYEISYETCDKRLNTIPIPMNINKIKYSENLCKDKLVIFHGLNRYGFKGTRHVEEAFNYLSKKYPDELELIIDGQLPLEDYLELMSRTNVVIDQINSYSLGVNGVYALAMGKVVLGGAEPESLKSLGVTSSPVINLKPNAKSIIDEVEKILKNKNHITSMGRASRKFAENVHGHIKIAEKYIKTWNV